MMCHDCGKPANIRFVEMVDGRLRALHLCDSCANTRGMSLSSSSLTGPLVDMLMGLLEEMGGVEEREDSGPVCPDCGLTYAEFRRTGKLGCGVCYDAFAAELRPLFRRVHGATQHTGTIPSKAPADAESVRQTRSLRLELERAVRREEYERAAEIRDEIRQLEETPVSSANTGGANTGGVNTGGAADVPGGKNVDV